MKYKWLFIILFIFCGIEDLQAQQYDKHWIVGWDGEKKPTGWPNIWNGITHFEFNGNNAPILYIDSFDMSFHGSNITISDNIGNLLFYTNGVTICNAENEIYTNGDSLGWGWFLKDFYPAGLIVGQPSPLRAICLPTNTNFNYNYFYLFVD